MTGELAPDAGGLPLRWARPVGGVQREVPTRGPGVNVAGQLRPATHARPVRVLHHRVDVDPEVGQALQDLRRAPRRTRCAPGVSPTQRWMPTPNDRCRLGLRSITNASASGNAASSRPDETSLSRTRSPARIGHPSNSKSSVTVRAWVRGRRVVAEELLGRGHQQVGIVEEALLVRRDLRQVQQGGADQRGGRVDATAHGHEHDRFRDVLRDPRAVDLVVGDRAHRVVARRVLARAPPPRGCAPSRCRTGPARRVCSGVPREYAATSWNASVIMRQSSSGKPSHSSVTAPGTGTEGRG